MSKRVTGTPVFTYTPAQLPEVLSEQIRQVVEASGVSTRDRVAVLAKVYCEYRFCLAEEETIAEEGWGDEE